MKKIESETEILRNRVNSWQADANKYRKEQLGLKYVWRKTGDLDKYPGQPAIWSMQENLLAACTRAINERKQIYIGSGHSLGKDFITGGIACWFLETFRPSNVILTGPTDRQVNDIMWKETLSHWNKRRVILGGKAFVIPRIEVAIDWYLTGFTTKEVGATKEGGGGKFQGFHAPNVAVLVTESQAVEDPIYDQIDAITTAGRVLVIFLGNPTRAKGRFAKGLKDNIQNIVFNLSCLENPNYVERREVLPGLASFEWVEDKRKKWGEQDPRWIGRVLGQVPEGGINSIFPESLIALMKGRNGMLHAHDKNAGVAWDPSGEGVDDEVWMGGNNGDILKVKTQSRMAPSLGALEAVAMCKEVNGYYIIVDCDGVGIKGYQELMLLEQRSPELMRGIQIIKFHGSGKSTVFEGAEDSPEAMKKYIYANMRAEAAFVTRDRALRGHASINALDTELIEDLDQDLWIENKNNGMLQVIPKEEIKENLGRSPGRGDCYKMLQWAFEQKYVDRTYGDANNLPGHSMADEDLYRSVQGLPRWST